MILSSSVVKNKSSHTVDMCHISFISRKRTSTKSEYRIYSAKFLQKKKKNFSLVGGLNNLCASHSVRHPI